MNKMNAISVSLLVIMMAVGSVDSFISSVCEKRMDSCLEAGKRMDIADIIKTALTVSNKFGVASYKATLAWKSIEEIEYAEDKKETTNENSQLTDVLGIDEYEGMLNELKPLLNKQETKTEKMKSLANQIKSMRESRGSNSTNLVRDAIAFARRATKSYGMNSTQSIAAWETFDKIADEEKLQTKPMTEIECLLDDIEKCLALEEMQRALKM